MSKQLDDLTNVPARAEAIRPFKIEVPEAVLVDLRERLARTRWPDQIPGTGWDYGTELAYLRQLCETWRTAYDWREHETALNRWPQFTTDDRRRSASTSSTRSRSTRTRSRCS